MLCFFGKPLSESVWTASCEVIQMFSDLCQSWYATYTWLSIMPVSFQLRHPYRMTGASSMCFWISVSSRTSFVFLWKLFWVFYYLHWKREKFALFEGGVSVEQQMRALECDPGWCCFLILKCLMSSIFFLFFPFSCSVPDIPGWPTGCEWHLGKIGEGW